MNSFSQVPPGFRFHPTDEELVDYYLRKKVASKRIEIDFIKDIDLYKIEPWDLQGFVKYPIIYIISFTVINSFFLNYILLFELYIELCKIGHEEQSDWFFFSHKDKKYPTGTRTNRATKEGFWKATGRDKSIYIKHNCLIGMRKTLVYYKGRAPNGQKSDWIMHEYRLETNENGPPQEEGWVVCRVFKKRLAAVRPMGDYNSSSPSHWYDDNLAFMYSEFETNGPRRILPNHQQHQEHQLPLLHSLNASSFALNNPNLQCKQELELQYNHMVQQQQHHLHENALSFLQLPHLESPKIQQDNSTCNPLPCDTRNTDNNSSHQDLSSLYMNGGNERVFMEQVTDWRVLDKFVASQLSNNEEVATVSASMQSNIGNDTSNVGEEYAASTSSSCQVDLWK
ncbi:unnamed protein product [Cochlearia groenlandica]